MTCDEPGCTGVHDMAFKPRAMLCPGARRRRLNREQSEHYREYSAEYFQKNKYRKYIYRNNRLNAADQKRLEEVLHAGSETQD